MKGNTMIRMGLVGVALSAMGVLAWSPNCSAPPKVATAQPQKAASGLPTERITIQGKEFVLEVAANTADIERGLSSRAEIAPGTGMVFVFPAGNERSFWMIDCLVDMDIAYLSADGTVLSVYSMKKEAPRGADESDSAYRFRLKRYLSGPGAQFAIETPAGTNDALKIKPGVKIPIDRPRLLAHLRRPAAQR